MIEKYFQQNIQMKLLGNPHYVKESDLLFDDSRFFKRLNATISISPVFCEEDFILGCFFVLRGDTADIILKTDGFNFEISGRLTILNVNFYGNDIILYSSSHKPCFNTNQICCSPDLMNQSYLSDECGLIGMTMNLTDKIKLSRVKGLFQLRVLYNETSILRVLTPSLNLTNVKLLNFNSLKMEQGWFTFIMVNTLLFSINFNNMILQNNFFPYGYLFTMSLEDDPFYNYLSADQLNNLYQLYPLSGNFQNLLNISNSIFKIFNNFSIKVTSGYTGTFEPSLFGLNSQQNPNTTLSFTNLQIINVFLASPTFFLSNLAPINVNARVAIIFNQTIMSFNNFLQFIYIDYSDFSSFGLTIDNNNIGANSMILMNVGSNTFNFFSTIFSNMMLSTTKPWIIAFSSIINFNKTAILNMTECFLYTSKGVVTHYNSTFFQVRLLKGQYWCDFYESSLIMLKLFWANCTITPTSGIYFHFFSSSPVQVTVQEAFLTFVFCYKMFQLESYVLLTNITFTHVKLYKTSGIFTGVYNYSLVFDCNVGSFNVLNFTDFYATEVDNLNMLFMLAYFNTIIYQDCILEKVNNIAYYVFGILPISGATNKDNTMLLSNFTIRDFYFYRFLDVNYVGNFGFLTLNNCTFHNITYNPAIADPKVRNQIFYLQVLKSFLLNSTYIDFTQFSFFVAFFSLYTANNVTMQNCVMEGKFNNSINRIPGLNARSFNYFFFINNTIMNLSNTQSPLDIADENGVITALASGGYFASNTLTTVLISGNVFYGNIGIKYGILSIIGANVATLLNNSFKASTAYYGGVLVIYSVAWLKIVDLTIDLSNGVEGGAIYLYDSSTQILVQNAVFRNCFAKNNGGGLVLLQVNNAQFTNIQSQNTLAQQNGGFISITNSYNVSFNEVWALNSSGLSGGLFYIDTSTVKFSQVYTQTTVAALSGGVFFITGTDSLVAIQHAGFSVSQAGTEGGVLTSMNIKNLTLDDCDISASNLGLGGNGIVNLLGFLIGDVNVGTFLLNNVVCRDNWASYGACLYYSSNNLLELRNMICSNNSGSVFNIESDEEVKLLFKNVTFINTNYLMCLTGNSLINPVNPIIVLINVNVEIRELHAINNTADANFMKVSTSTLKFSNCDFANFFNVRNASSSVLARFLSVSDSIMVFAQSSMRYTDLTLKTCMFLDIRTSSVNITESLFNTSNNLQDAASINIEESTAIFFKNTFLNLSGIMASLNIKTSSLNLDSCVFMFNKNSAANLDDDASDINFMDDDVSGGSILIINGSSFLVPERNSLSVKKAYQVNILRSSFNGVGVPGSFSRALYLQDNEFFYMDSTKISDFKAPVGAGVFLTQLTLTSGIILSAIILNSNFANCMGTFGSAVYFLGEIEAVVNSSSFLNNSAVNAASSFKITSDDTGKGGCVLADCEYYPYFKLSLYNNNFTNNSAQNLAPTVLCKSQNKSSCMNAAGNIFEKNSDGANFTDSLSGTPIKLVFLSSDFTANQYPTYYQNFNNNNSLAVANILKKFMVSKVTIVSGQTFDFSVMILDNFNQLMVFESKTSGTLSCYFVNESNPNSTNQIVFVDKSTTQSMNGILTFSGAKIIFPPNNSLSCHVDISLPDTLFFKSDLELGVDGTVNRTMRLPIELFLRKCIPGEILLEDHSCFQCLKGTYLFDDPMAVGASKKCNICPDNAYCQGGADISPWSGYWRNSNTSSLIVQCPTSESCRGIGNNLLDMMNLSNLTNEDKIHGVCDGKYWGNLCYQCQKGYGRAKTNDVCAECANLWVVYLKMALSMIFMIVYVAIQASIFSRTERQNPNLAVLMKLLLNHFQTISMISLVELGWTLDFNIYFSFQNYLSFLTEDFFIIDCMVQNINQNLLIQKIIFTILLPVILSIIMITFWIVTFMILLHRRRKKGANLKLLTFLTQNMRITLLTLLYILYPEILRKCFTLINCLVLDDSVSYTVLSMSPNIQCWAGDHTLWVLTVSFPGLLIWGIMTPVFILLILFKYKEKIQLFIYETQTLSMSHRSLNNKKQPKFILKKIVVEIDEFVRKKLFEKEEIPGKHEIKYRKEEKTFLETTEIKLKSTIEITKERNKEAKIVEPNESQEIDFPNINKIVEEVVILAEYLDFLDKKIEEIFTEKDLKEHPVHVIEEFEEKEENEDRKFSLKEKVKSMKSVEGVDASKTALVIRNLGFIYRGYKPEYYFWEVVMFSRKFLLIFIGVFTEFFPKKTKPTMLIIILVGYMYSQIKFNPYFPNHFNKLESMSLAVVFTTANIGILLFSEVIQRVSALFVLIVFFINFCYLVYWVKCLYEFGQIKEKFLHFIILWRWIKGKLIQCLK